MKTAIVPAQITTVEDRLAGNLTMSQLILLAAPLLVDFMLYALLPPLLRLSALKLTLMISLSLSSPLLAIRFQGKILLIWVITIWRYYARPRQWVYNKNDYYLRSSVSAAELQYSPAVPTVVRPKLRPIPALAPTEVVKLENWLSCPQAKLRFLSSKKGGLDVCITEVKPPR